MEGIFFLADILLMVVLCFVIFRTERKPDSESLGLFSYKAVETPDHDEGEHRA